MSNKGLITFTSHGDLKYVNGFFKKVKQKNFIEYLEYFAKKGVELLALETPVDTGVTASSWGYEITQEKGRITITWTNSSTAGDSTIPVVMLIQYGHATRNGGYVPPYDFINPVTQELFNEMANTIWREVTST